MKRLVLLGVLAFPVLAASEANAILIDSFNDLTGSGITIQTGATFPLGPVTVATGEAIGGFRTYEVLSGQTNDAIFVDFGLLNVTDAGNGPSAFRITYDQDGAGLGGGLGLDLTDSGASDGISFEIFFIDQGGVTTTITVTDTLGGTASLTLPQATDVGANDFFFTEFVGSADFTRTTAIVLDFALTNASDLNLDFIETINVEALPVSAAALLFGTGLLTLSVAARRRG